MPQRLSALTTKPPAPVSRRSAGCIIKAFPQTIFWMSATGSGILSLAAAKLWGEKCAVTAVDIDEEAVWVTRQNAQNNSVDHLITAEVSDGFHAGIVKQNAPYQLILANILARPLLDMGAGSGRIAGFRRLCRFVRVC